MNKSGQIEACGISAVFSGDMPILSFADGTIIMGERTYLPPDNDLEIFGIMEVVLCPNTGGIIILDGNGKVFRLRLNGIKEEIYNFKTFADKMVINKKRNILAIAAGKKISIINLKTNAIDYDFTLENHINSLDFDLKGENLSVGHAKGISVLDLKNSEPPFEFKANGGVFASIFAPDMRFLIAATGEPSLIGWRLTDGTAFRMSGYPQKPTTLEWINNGEALATSGGPFALVWPFIDKDGPMGKNALTIDTRRQIVNKIAVSGFKIALGFNDGAVGVADVHSQLSKHIGGIDENLETSTDPRDGQERISSIAINKRGNLVAWVSESGKWGISNT